jgi:ABC-2 type transport system permease protein
LAIHLPAFAVLALLYFTMSFFLFGAAFLGIGAQAPSARDIQLLSLPISVFQVSMFALASSAASQPGSGLALFAQIFPFSSPMAMAARAASDAALWPHLLAILWQLLWVIVIVRLSARLFRHGVLNANPSLFRFFRRKTA